MSDTHRHAWAAGFLDGDGCFSLAGYGKNQERYGSTSRAVTISAGNNNLAPLEELQALYGGELIQSRSTAIGSEHWRWCLNGAAQVRETIIHLLPYLIDKKEAAEIVFAFSLLVGKRGVRVTDENKAARQELIDAYAVMRKG